MTALDACHAARRAWEQSEPQTFMDFDALTERGMPRTGHSLKPDAARDGDVPGMSVETGPGGASPAPRSVNAFQVSPPVGAVTLLSLGAEHDTGGEQSTGQGTNHVRMRGVPALAPEGHAGTSLAGTPFAKNVNSPSVQSPGMDGALRGSQEAC